ncbi:hypothetical protein DIPPA_18744 [Diplonema papillatum]|nr:hypothetical protein DIPPA_18744 [Diplonema papillatum]
MESGCLPMLFGEEIGCQTEAVDAGCDAPSEFESDESGSGDELDEDEEWVLEQIELAYQKLKQTTALAEYEKRRGLVEVKAAYKRLCGELGEPRKDHPSWSHTLTASEALVAYRPLFHDALNRRSKRESEVSLLCKDIRETWIRADFHAPDDDFYREVTAVASYLPRKKGRYGTVAMLPASARLLTVHRDTVEVLRNTVEMLRSRFAPPGRGVSAAPAELGRGEAALAPPCLLRETSTEALAVGSGPPAEAPALSCLRETSTEVLAVGSGPPALSCLRDTSTEVLAVGLGPPAEAPALSCLRETSTEVLAVGSGPPALSCLRDTSTEVLAVGSGPPALSCLRDTSTEVLAVGSGPPAEAPARSCLLRETSTEVLAVAEGQSPVGARGAGGAPAKRVQFGGAPCTGAAVSTGAGTAPVPPQSRRAQLGDSSASVSVGKDAAATPLDGAKPPPQTKRTQLGDCSASVSVAKDGHGVGTPDTESPLRRRPQLGDSSASVSVEKDGLSAGTPDTQSPPQRRAQLGDCSASASVSVGKDDDGAATPDTASSPPKRSQLGDCSASASVSVGKDDDGAATPDTASSPPKRSQLGDSGASVSAGAGAPPKKTRAPLGDCSSSVSIGPDAAGPCSTRPPPRGEAGSTVTRCGDSVAVEFTGRAPNGRSPRTAHVNPEERRLSADDAAGRRALPGKSPSVVAHGRPAVSGGGMARAEGAKKTRARQLWEDAFEPAMAKMNLGRTEWAERMREVVESGAESEETALAILAAAEAQLPAAQSLHDEITEGLKRFAQTKATLDCCLQMSNRRVSRFRTATRANQVQEDTVAYSKQLSNLSFALLPKLSDFQSATRGLPFVLDSLLVELLGIPARTSDILVYLTDIPPTLCD